MIAAPFPEKDCDTVGEYNRTRGTNKAWTIVGMTWQGEAFCRDCVHDWPTYENDLVDGPKPVFGSDDYEDMVCGECRRHLA